MSRHPTYAREEKRFPYIEKLFRELSDDGRDSLNSYQFCTLLNELNLQIPIPIMHNLFNQIKSVPSNRISLRDFETFLLDDKAKVRLKERYSILINKTPDYGFTMSNDPEINSHNTIITELWSKRAEESILPGSEILYVGERCVEGRKSKEIERILKEKLEEGQPVKMVLHRKLTPHNLAKLAGNSTWRTLGKEIGRKRRRKRMDLIKLGPELPDDDPLKQLPYCPREPGWKQYVYRSFEDEEFSSISGWILALVMFCIIISTFAFVLETIPSLEGHWMFVAIEYFVSLFFTLEYGAKILTCRNMWLFFWDPMNMIDFLAIIPFWVSLTFSSKDSATLRVIRVVRLTRLLRLLKSPQFKEYMTLVTRALVRSTQAFFLTFTMIVLYLIIFGSVIYMFERGTENEDGVYLRPDGSESPYDSILKAIYWCIVSMTSVGYGDFYPTTNEGRSVSCFTLLSGVLVIALPVIIIGGELGEVLEENKRQKVDEEKVLESDMFKYFTEINRIINDVCEEGGTNNFIEYFSKKDVNNFIDAGLDSRAKLLGLFRNGIHNLRFIPPTVQKKKIMYLYYLFGKRESQTSEFEGANRIRKKFNSKLLFPPKEEKRDPIKSKREKIHVVEFKAFSSDLSNDRPAANGNAGFAPSSNGADGIMRKPKKESSQPKGDRVVEMTSLKQKKKKKSRKRNDGDAEDLIE